MNEFTWPPTPDHDAGSDANLDTLTSDGQIASNDTVPAVMVAVASSIIICAAALYLSDLHERCRRNRRYCSERELEGQKHVVGTMTSSGNYWITTSTSMHRLKNSCCHDGSFPVLSLREPFDEDKPEKYPCEDISLSPISTMTASYAAQDNRNLHRMNSDTYLAQSSVITELSEADRVHGETDLSNLVDLSRMHTLGSSAQNSEPENDFASDQEESFSPRRIRIDDTIYIISDNEKDESGWNSPPASESSSEVSVGTYLKSVHSGRSRFSSKGSDRAEFKSLHGKAQNVRNCLYGEQYSEDSSTNDISLARLPDTPYRVRGAAASTDRNGLVQLERLYTGRTDRLRQTKERKLSFLEALLERGRATARKEQEEATSLDGSTEIVDSANHVYGQNIFFAAASASMGTDSSLGIEPENATYTPSHPSASSIDSDSLLRKRCSDPGRLDTSSDDGEASMDTGIESTAVEV